MARRVRVRVRPLDHSEDGHCSQTEGRRPHSTDDDAAAAGACSDRRCPSVRRRWLSVVFLLFSLCCLSSPLSLPVRAQPPASTYTTSCASGPARRTGWLPTSGTEGACFYDDPAPNPQLQPLQYINLQSSVDVSGPLPGWPNLALTSSNPFSFSLWLCMGKLATQANEPGSFPGIWASGGGNLLSMGLGTIYDPGLFYMLFAGGAADHSKIDYGKIGSANTNPWRPYQWVHVGVLFQSSGAWTMYLNGVKQTSKGNNAGDWFTGITPSTLRWGAVDVQTASPPPLQGGFAEMRSWWGQTLSDAHFTHLAKNPPSMLIAAPPYMESFPSLMNRCADSATVVVYPPFQFDRLWNINSVILTVTPAANGGITAPTPTVTMSAATTPSWASGSFTLSSNFLWGTATTVSFTSSDARMGAPSTRTVMLKTGSVVAASAYLMSRFNGASALASTATPSAQGHMISFGASATSWSWSAANLGLSSGFPDTWSGKYGYTFEFWLRFSAVAANNMRLLNNYASDGFGFAVTLSLATPRVKVSSVVGTEKSSEWTAPPFATDTDYHIVVVGAITGNVRVYLNGAALKHATLTTLEAHPVPPPLHVLRQTAVTDQFVSGAIMRLGFWMRPLDADSVAALYAWKPVAARAPGVSALVVSRFRVADDPAVPTPLLADGTAALGAGFVPGDGSTVYAISVPYKVSALTFTATLASGSTASLEWECGASNTVALTSDTPSAQQSLVKPAGTTPTVKQFQVTSSWDGLYTLHVTRAAPAVQSITLRGWTAAGVDSGIVGSSVFGKNDQLFAVSVPALVTKISVLVVFNTGDSVSVSVAGVEALAAGSVVSGTQSAAVTLPAVSAGPSRFVVHSAADGSYTFVVTRVAKVAGVSTSFRRAAGGGTTSPPQPLSSPSFVPGTLTGYSVVAPYNWETFDFSVEYSSAAGSVQYAWAGGALTATPASTAFTAVHFALPAPGAASQSLVLESSTDGSYVIQVSRAAQQVSGFGLRCNDVDGLAQAHSFSSAFTPGLVSYSVALGGQWLQCDVAVSYGSGGAVTISVASLSYSSAAPLSGSYTDQNFPLPLGGTLTVVVESSTDGAYTLSIGRAGWIVSTIEAEVGTGASGLDDLLAVEDVALAQGSLSLGSFGLPFKYTAVRLRAVFAAGAVVASMDSGTGVALVTGEWSAPLLLGAPGLHFVHITSPVEGVYEIALAREEADVRAVSLITTPGVSLPFTRGVFSAPGYSVDVPYASDTLAVSAKFFVDNSVTLVINGAPVGGGMPLQSEVSTGATALLVGLNTVALASEPDGLYTFNVTRAPQRVGRFDLMCESNDVTGAQPFALATVVAGTFAYSKTMVAQWHQCTLAISYAGGAGTMTVALPPAAAEPAPASGDPTAPFSLLLNGDTVVVVSSSADGDYTLTISRGDWAVSSLALQVGTGPAGTADSTALTYSPSLTQGAVDGYTATVSYVVSGVRVAAEFVGGATVDLAGAGSEALVSGAADWSSTFLLDVGPNVLHVVSPADGSYTVTVTRSPQSVRWLQLSASSTLTGAAAAVALVPDWQPNVLAYTAAVGAPMDRYAFNVSFVDDPLLSASSGGVAVGAPVSGADSAALPLPFGFTLLELSSSRDGPYSVNVTRSAGDVAQVLLHALAEAPAVVGADPALAAPLLLQPTPAFFGGVFFAYNASVAFVHSQLSVTPLYDTADSLQVLHGDGASATEAAVGSGSASAPLALAVGSTSVRVRSARDGLYEFNVTRRAPDLLLSAMIVRGVSEAPNVPSGAISTTAADGTPAPLRADEYAYAARVPFAIAAVTLQLAFASEGTVLLRDGAFPAVAGIALQSGQATAPIALHTGINVVQIESALDGSYRIAITRAPLDLTAFAVSSYGAAAADPPSLLADVSASLVAEGPPAGFVGAHSLGVDFIVRAVRVQATFGEPDSVLLGVEVDGALVAAAEALTNGQPSGAVALRVGLNVLRLNSTQDGMRLLRITRAPPTVTAINVSVQLRGSGQWIAGPSPLLALQLQPAFDPQAQMAYGVTLPFVAQAARLAADFGTATLQIVGSTSTTVTAWPVALASGVTTAEAFILNAAPTLTTFHLHSSKDGLYTISIAQEEPDVSSILLVGFTKGGTSVPVSFGPPFARGNTSLVASVPFKIDRVVVAAWFSTNGSVSIRHTNGSVAAGAAAAATPLSSGVQSPALFPLLSADVAPAPGTNVLTLHSSRDGNYTLCITRAAPAVTGLLFRSWSDGAAPVDALLSPGFVPGSTNGTAGGNYTLIFPRVRSFLSVWASFSGTVHAALGAAAPLALVSDTWSAAMALPPAGSEAVLVLDSPGDGEYRVLVRHLPADVVALSATGTTSPGSAGPGSPPKLLPLSPRIAPAFAPGAVFAYSMVLPNIVAQVAFAAGFGVANSLTLRVNNDPASGSAVALVSGAHSPNFALAPGATAVFELLSAQDGVYTINVTRSLPDLTALALWRVDPSGATAPAALPSEALVPAFQPGVVFAYEVAVASSVAHVALVASFGVAGSLNLSSSASGGAQQQLQSGVPSGAVALSALPLSNTLRLWSAEDGVYTLSISRANFNPCASGGTLCLNGGSCVPAADADAVPAYTCTCAYGFAGSNCSVCVAASSAACPAALVSRLEFVSPPSTARPCAPLQLQARATGFDAQVLLYSFRIESVTMPAGQTIFANASTALAPLFPFNETLGVTLGEMKGESLLQLPSHILWDNASYVFSVSVGVTTHAAVAAGGFPAPVWSEPVRTAVWKEGSAAGMVAWMPSVAVTAPPLLTRSAEAKFQATVLPSSCAPLPSDARHQFEWSVVEAGTGAGGEASANGTVVFQSKAAALVVPARTLRAGQSYTVHLLLTSSSLSAAGPSGLAGRRLLAQTAQTGTARVSVGVVVTPQPLLASIDGGRRMSSVDVAFELDASRSADPDWIGPTQPSPVLFEWSATWLPSPNNDGLPAVALPLAPLGLVLNGAKLQVPANTFLSLVGADRVVLLTFTARVVLRTDAARAAASASVEVELVPKPPLPLPRVRVSVPVLASSSSSSSGFVNPTQSLTLLGSVEYNSTGAGAGLLANTTGGSSVTRVVNLRYRWVCVEPASLALDLRSAAVVSSVLDNENLVIRANQLVPGLLHRFRLVVSDPAFDAVPLPEGAARAGWGEVEVMANQPPRGGSCSASPTSGGESLSTQFLLSCNGWSDAQGHEPLRYSFSYTNLDVDPARARPPSLLAGFGYAATMQTMLPAGRLELSVAVADTLDAAAFYTIPLNVSLPLAALSDPACFVKNMSGGALASAMAQQDAAASYLLITQLSSVLNSAGNSSCNDGSSNSTDSGSTDQLRQDLLQNLAGVAGSGTNTTMSPETLQLVSQALGSLTADPGAMNNSATWDLTNDILKDAIASIPPSSSGADYSGIANSLANTASNLLVDCARLDSVSSITQAILSAALNGTVAGSGNALNTTNLQASATRSNIDGGANVTLPSGVSVYLSAEALLQYASELASGGGGSLALDTRVVTFDPRWASCRNNSGSGIISSELTTIDITLSDGKVVDLTQLLAPITFLLPFNMTRFLQEHPPEPVAIVKQNCSNLLNSTASTVANATLDTCPSYLASALTCSFWDVANKSFSTRGCRNEGFVQNCSAVQCSCGHLTEFAVIYQASLRRPHVLVVGECGAESYPGDTESTLGLQYYLVFFAAYSAVALAASVQLGRVLASSRCRHWLMAVEHALVLAVGVFRAWNMLNYWRLYRFIPLTYITLISGVPHLFTSWIFTFVIFAWAAIYHNSVAGRREENPFRSYQSVFISINTLVSGCLFALFALMSRSGLDKQQMLYESGVTLIAIVSILFGVFFIVYGLLLVRSLTKDFSSPYARKLLVVALGFSCAFFASSGILLLSVLEGQYYKDHLVMFNCAYFSLDLLVLGIVMGLFGKSVNDSIASSRAGKEEGTRTSIHTRTATATTNKKFGHAQTKSDAGAKSGAASTVVGSHRRNVGSVAPSVSKGPIGGSGGGGGAIASTKVAAPMPDAPVLLLHPDDVDNPWGDWGPDDKDADANPWIIDGEGSDSSDEGSDGDGGGGSGAWAQSPKPIPSAIQSPSGLGTGAGTGAVAATSPAFVRGRIYAAAVASKYLLAGKKAAPSSSSSSTSENSTPRAAALVSPLSSSASASRPASAEKEKDKSASPSTAGPIVSSNAPRGMHARARSIASKYVPARLAHAATSVAAGARAARVTVHLDQDDEDEGANGGSAAVTPAKGKANGHVAAGAAAALPLSAHVGLSPSASSPSLFHSARAASDDALGASASGNSFADADLPATPSARGSGASTPTPIAGVVVAPSARRKLPVSYGRSAHLPPGIGAGGGGGNSLAVQPSSSLPSSGPPSRQWSRRSSLSEEQLGTGGAASPADNGEQRSRALGFQTDTSTDRPALMRARGRSLSVDQGNGNGGLSLSFGTTAQLQVGFLPNIVDSPFVHPMSLTPSTPMRPPSSYGLDGPGTQSHSWLDATAPPLLAPTPTPATPTQHKFASSAFAYPNRSPAPDDEQFRPTSTSPALTEQQQQQHLDATSPPPAGGAGRGLRATRLPAAAALRFATSAPRDRVRRRTEEPRAPPTIQRDGEGAEIDAPPQLQVQGSVSARSHPLRSSLQNAATVGEAQSASAAVRLGWRVEAESSASGRRVASPPPPPPDSLDSLVTGGGSPVPALSSPSGAAAFPSPASVAQWGLPRRLPSPLHSPPAPLAYSNRGSSGGRGVDFRAPGSLAGAFALSPTHSAVGATSAPSPSAHDGVRAGVVSPSVGRRPLIDAAHTLLNRTQS